MSDDRDRELESGPAWEDPRRVLARHGQSPSRRFSQNFLVARSVVEAIAEAVAPAAGERVVELGPGAGTLTAALLRRGASVVAVEKDRRMISLLREELGAFPTFEVREGDAAELDLSALLGADAPPVAIAGNLPYAITGAIFRAFVGERARIDRAVVMVQREVRDRLLASPGSKTYGALGVFVGAAFDVVPVLMVKPGAFFPPPRVTSAVVRLVPRAKPRAEETEGFRRVVRAVFDQRRKTLRNALSSLAPADRVEAALAAVGVDPGARGETLEIEAFDAIASALEASAP